VDLILETPGGSGEVAEDIVRLLRAKYEDVGVIIPGYAKSAGTIMAMSADEILMDCSSSLGPIDAQIQWQGKVFSAEALLEGMKRIKKEVEDTGVLNKAYIPMLQGISPGELQNAENALEFSRSLVKDWLAHYKFRTWTEHSSTRQAVTEADRVARAAEISEQLCEHKHWLTHGRSIKIDDLEKMRLRITDFGRTPDLADAIRRYYTLLQMTFATNIYKVFETPTSQIYRFIAPNIPPPPQQAQKHGILVIETKCGNCGFVCPVQANIGKLMPLQEGHVPFPGDNKFRCPNCGTAADLSDARRQIEMQTKNRLAT
jgi:predicted RNA-binding Zn-ribbon protein involved in translation (DUF1610 family)